MAPPNLNSKDYYDILGCPRNADDAQLKKAYRKLAVKVSVLRVWAFVESASL
jgi:preprotein translocase subunit Sec63